MLLTIVALTFLTVFCLALALFLGIRDLKQSPKSELRRRLRQMARRRAHELPESLRAEITRETQPLDRIMAHLPLTRNLERKLDRAGLTLGTSAFAGLTLAALLAGAVVAAIACRSSWALPFGAAAALALVQIYLRIKARIRLQRFTEHFPDALGMIARSLRAGHSFNTAVQLVGQEIPDPVGELFKTAFEQQQLGLRLTEGLSNLNERIDSLDLRFFTTVISINVEVGGNLSEILDKLAETIRERLRIRRQIGVYTAQGRLSGYVLGVLPVIAFFMFNLLNPTYEAVLVREPLGLMILAGAISLQMVGLLMIRKIIAIRI